LLEAKAVAPLDYPTTILALSFLGEDEEIAILTRGRLIRTQLIQLDKVILDAMSTSVTAIHNLTYIGMAKKSSMSSPTLEALEHKATTRVHQGACLIVRRSMKASKF